MTNFVTDRTGLPLKTQWDGVSSEVDEPDMYVSSTDYNLLRQACFDLRGYTGPQVINALERDVIGDGVADDGPALAALINANPGVPIALPKRRYVVDNPIVLTTTSCVLIGAFGNRFAQGGTEILYTGTGPCIQIGTDNGHNWGLGEYNGVQDHLFMNFRVRHAAPDTNLASVGAAGSHFKANAQGMWDWRGGGITMQNCGFEGFETNWGGVQSDLNQFNYVLSIYSKYGFYFGPRSDQNTIRDLYSYYCDRCVTIDRAGQTQILQARMVFSGTNAAAPIEVRKGSHGVVVDGLWHENSGIGSGLGYQGTDGLAAISVGEIDGYGTGSGGSVSAPGSSPVTTPVAGCDVLNPHLYPLPAGPAHKKYIAAVGFCNQFRMVKPTCYINSGLSSFDALVATQSGQNPTSSDTQIAILETPRMTRSQIYQNLGAGSPIVYSTAFGRMDSVELGIDIAASHVIRGAVSHLAPTGVNALTTINGNAGATVAVANWKLLANGSYDATAGNQFPVGLQVQQLATRSAGANSVAQTAAQFDCSGAQTDVALETQRGRVRLNTSSGFASLERAVFFGNEIAPASLSADQTDWAPTGIADASLIMVTSSVAVAINSIALDSGAAGFNGRDVVIYNNNPAGGANVTLRDEAAALGTELRRIVGRNHADTVLTPGTGARLRYSQTKQRALIIGDTL